MTMMEMIQVSAPAIRDLGIYDVEKWAGGFENLYTEVFGCLFNKKKQLHEYLVPVLQELERESYCGTDIQLLAVSLSRVGASLAFIKMSTDKDS